MRLPARALVPRLFFATLVAAALLSPGPGAAVTVTIDADTLNDILSVATMQEVEVPLTGSRSVTVVLENLEVVRLDPAADELITRVRLKVRELGVTITTEPRIRFDVAEEDGLSVLELRFVKLSLPLPLAGEINIARLIPPLRYPVDSIWLLAGVQGDVEVRSRLERVRMGRDAVEFRLAIEVLGLAD